MITTINQYSEEYDVDIQERLMAVVESARGPGFPEWTPSLSEDDKGLTRQCPASTVHHSTLSLVGLFNNYSIIRANWASGRRKVWRSSSSFQSDFTWWSEPSRELTYTRDTIRYLSDTQPPEEAWKSVAALWEELEKTAELAEARMRLLLAKLPAPQLAAETNWLKQQLLPLETADANGPAIHPAVIASTRKLILACLASKQEPNLEAELSKGPLGRIEVDWDLPSNGLRWLVEASQNPWPGVKVYVLFRNGTGKNAQRTTRIFHTAFEVIEHFREHAQ